MKTFIFKICLLIVCLIFGVGTTLATDVTYTVASTTSVSTSGTAPKGSSASFKNTYSAKDQLTGGNVMTLTLDGYEGKKITGIVLSMKSNKSSGEGYLSVKAGTTTLASIDVHAFNNTYWNGSYTTTYTDVIPEMTNSSYVIQSGEKVVIKIGATVNSLYCQSFRITYEDGSSVPQPTMYNVNISKDIVNGTVSASSSSAQAGATITLTSLPDAGYEFTSWNVTNASTNADIKVIDNKFYMPASDVTVSAVFSKNQETDPVDQDGVLVYRKIASQNDIVNGGVYLIVCEKENTAMGSQSTNRRNNASVSIINNTISLLAVNTDNYPYEVTLGKDIGRWTMSLSNGNFLGNGASSSNNLKEVMNVTDGYRWTLNFENDGSVTMTTDQTNKRILCVNTTNADSYATYASIDGYKKVTLYKKSDGPQEIPNLIKNTSDELYVGDEIEDLKDYLNIPADYTGTISFSCDDACVEINDNYLLAKTEGTATVNVKASAVDGKYLETSGTITFTISKLDAGFKYTTVTLNGACHDDKGNVYSTYSNSSAWVVPEGLIVSEVSVEDGKLRIRSYATDAIVPPNTGVMLSVEKDGIYTASDAGIYTITVKLSADEGMPLVSGDNRLRPTNNGVTADEMSAADPDCIYYRLTMHNGSQIGYWWGAENGGAFAVAANKAYLAVPKQHAAKMMGVWVDDDRASYIDYIKENDRIRTGTAYNLVGQRVSHNAKGIIIQNGKKIINK